MLGDLSAMVATWDPSWINLINVAILIVLAMVVVSGTYKDLLRQQEIRNNNLR